MLWARTHQFCGARPGPPELSVCRLRSAQPLDCASFPLLQPLRAPPPSSRQREGALRGTWAQLARSGLLWRRASQEQKPTDSVFMNSSLGKTHQLEQVTKTSRNVTPSPVVQGGRWYSGMEVGVRPGSSIHLDPAVGCYLNPSSLILEFISSDHIHRFTELGRQGRR